MIDRLPPFDLIDLRLLLALAEHRHFARAAAACGLSQPALSARIQRLEIALAAPLIFRGKRFEGFTPQGEHALSWAKRILADCSGLLQDASSSDGLTGVLRIGVVPSAAPLAGRICGVLAARYPGLAFRVLSLSSTEIEARLANFSLDAGLSYLGRESAGKVEGFSLYQETYCLVIGPNTMNVPGNNGRLGWLDAAKMPLCLLTQDMQNRRIIDEAFKEVGCKPEPKFESNSFNAILALVRHSNFATILPRVQVNEGLSGNLNVLNLDTPDICSQLGLLLPDQDPMLPVSAAMKAALPEIRALFDRLC